MKIEDYKECLLLAGNLATAAHNVANGSAFDISTRISEMWKALREYDALILHKHEMEKKGLL